MSDPPGWSVNVLPFQKPARRSMIWLVAPRIWLAIWHSPQPAPLKIGPRPSAVVSGPVNSSTAASKSHSSSGIRGELGELVNASWFAQNSSANPFDSTENPVGASVGPSATARSPSPTRAGSVHAAATPTITILLICISQGQRLEGDEPLAPERADSVRRREGVIRFGMELPGERSCARREGTAAALAPTRWRRGLGGIRPAGCAAVHGRGASGTTIARRDAQGGTSPRRTSPDRFKARRPIVFGAFKVGRTLGLADVDVNGKVCDEAFPGRRCVRPGGRRC